MSIIKYSLFIALLLSLGTTLKAQSDTNKNQSAEKSVDTINQPMEMMMQFLESFSGDLFQGLEMEGIQDIEMTDEEKEAILESMSHGMELFQNMDTEQLQDMMLELQKQFEGMEFGQPNKDSAKEKKTIRI